VREFARLPQPPADGDVSGEEREDYDRVIERTSRVHGLDGIAATYFGALLQSPPLAATLVQLGTGIRQGQLRGTYTDAERELMDIVLAVELGDNAILAVHIPDAVAVGVRPDAIAAIIERCDNDLTDDERQLAEYARAFVAGSVDDTSYASIRDRFGDRGAVEFTILLGFLLMTIRLWQAFGVPQPSDEEIAALLSGLRDGTITPPDPAARIG
jgi:carboxymuconolactone decarboxylase family protein